MNDSICITEVLNWNMNAMYDEFVKINTAIRSQTKLNSIILDT